jgi:hypothetical protein
MLLVFVNDLGELFVEVTKYLRTFVNLSVNRFNGHRISRIAQRVQNKIMLAFTAQSTNPDCRYCKESDRHKEPKGD